jgi:hypothetical protein
MVEADALAAQMEAQEEEDEAKVAEEEDDDDDDFEWSDFLA